MLLDSLLSKTPKEHPDYNNIEAAGQKIKDITGFEMKVMGFAISSLMNDY